MVFYLGGGVISEKTRHGKCSTAGNWCLFNLSWLQSVIVVYLFMYCYIYLLYIYILGAWGGILVAVLENTEAYVLILNHTLIPVMSLAKNLTKLKT